MLKSSETFFIVLFLLKKDLELRIYTLCREELYIYIYTSNRHKEQPDSGQHFLDHTKCCFMWDFNSPTWRSKSRCGDDLNH